MEQNLAKRQKELTRCLVDCSARSRRSAPNALVSVEESLVLVSGQVLLGAPFPVRPLFHSPLASTTPTVERPWLCGQTDRRDNARSITGSQRRCLELTLLERLQRYATPSGAASFCPIYRATCGSIRQIAVPF
jgi:hypothetical protein